jgi:hypothetical protein
MSNWHTSKSIGSIITFREAATYVAREGKKILGRHHKFSSVTLSNKCDAPRYLSAKRKILRSWHDNLPLDRPYLLDRRPILFF